MSFEGDREDFEREKDDKYLENMEADIELKELLKARKRIE
jgi:hypothetical protein